MVKRGYLLLGAFLSTAVHDAFATTLEKVLDGDTVIIGEPAQRYHLRLLDIDAPELHQAFGKQAQRSLYDQCKNAQVTVEIQGTDRYGRTLGYLYCNGQDSSTYQVTQGMAWFNRKYSQNTTLNLLQRQAEQDRIGLWQQQRPMPPWTWRKRYGAHYHRQE